MKTLETKTYSLPEGTYIGQLEPFRSEGIPTNCIVDKVEPGTGATRAEIDFKERNSISVVPPVTCIKVKAKKHPEIQAVYKGITTAHIVAYLKNDVYPKKIVCTPEGYVDKVVDAVKEAGFDLHNDFFLLLDECDKLITDVDYRGKIIAPMKDFFDFKGKAMVSATVIQPSYKQFYEHDFKIVKIIPDYSIIKPIDLISTNNVASSLRKLLDEEREHPVFIFLNSTLTIHALVTLLNIQEKTKVFCAEESARELYLKGIENTATEIEDFAPINIFTSRFFSAVDIDLPYKPDIIMITDVLNARHSILDPAVECAQICGRFREGRGKITHITNYDPNMKCRKEEAAREFLNGGYSAYREMLSGHRNAKSEGKAQAYKEGIDSISINKFVDEDHELDAFMVDNFVHEEKVKSYYLNPLNLQKAYEDSKRFDVYPTKHVLPISDADNIKLAAAKSQVDLARELARRLDIYTEPDSPGTIVFKLYDPSNERNRIKERYPDIYDCWDELGTEQMSSCDFKKGEITKLINTKRKYDERYNDRLVADIFKTFKADSQEVESDAVQKLKDLYLKHGIPLNASAAHLNHYFDAKRSTGGGMKVYNIGKRRDIDIMRQGWKRPISQSKE